jgi:HK97 gp10 family phage protein
LSEFQGIEQFKRQLEALDKKLRNKLIRTALRNGGKRMALAVRGRAPVLSGRLKGSVKVVAGRRKKDHISINVVTTGGHEGPFVGAVEYGTADAPAHPFIRPAFNAEKAPTLVDMIGEIKSGLEKVGG